MNKFRVSKAVVFWFSGNCSIEDSQKKQLERERSIVQTQESITDLQKIIDDFTGFCNECNQALPDHEAYKAKLQADLDSKVWENSKARTKAQEKIVKNEETIAQLRLDNEEIDKKTGTTADTGFSGNDQGFSKLTELKEAFMIT